MPTVGRKPGVHFATYWDHLGVMLASHGLGVGYPKREISFVTQPGSTTVTALGRVEVPVEMSKNCCMFTQK